MTFEVEKAAGLMLKLMRKKEPLRSDLWAYLDHSAPASEGLVLGHPLLHITGISMERAAWVNHLVQTAEKAAAKALAEERWLDYVFLHEPSHRLGVFSKLAKKLPDAVYWKSLSVLYIKTRDIWQQKRQLVRLLTANRSRREQLMSAYERRYFARLPSRLTIYRACEPRRVPGWNWMLDESKARRSLEMLRLATGRARRSDVIAYFSRRREKEIVVDPAKVKIVGIERLPNRVDDP
jgi:hypothetical protein